MQDPFGNDFCLVRDLTKEQSAAAVAAAKRGVKNDRALREAAGQTEPDAVAATRLSTSDQQARLMKCVRSFRGRATAGSTGCC